MNRTKALYRLGLVVSALLLIAAAVLAVVPAAVAFQISALSLGVLGTLLTSHLRMRLSLTTQRSALRTTLAHHDEQATKMAEQLAEIASVVRATDTSVQAGMGDTQAAVAASESFLLSELSTIRQRVALVGEMTARELPTKLMDHTEQAKVDHRWVQGQFQQLRAQIEHLPSDTGEYSALRRLLIPDQSPMPQLGGWAISSATVDSLVHTALTADGPRTIVELGSGASTIWLAHALRSRGTGGHIHSLDHLEEFGAKTRAMLEAHGLTEFATVHIAPLVSVVLDGKTFSWYDAAALPAGIRIDMLLVDGPPAGTTEHNRYPALPQLADRLTDGALVYLDDTIRTDEKQVIELWLSEFPALRREEILPKSTILRWRPHSE